MPRTYAVIWKDERGRSYAGKLALSNAGVELDGAGPGGASARTIDYDHVCSFRPAPAARRLSGRRTLVLEVGEGASVEIGMLDPVGTAHEVAEALAAHA